MYYWPCLNKRGTTNANFCLVFIHLMRQLEFFDIPSPCIGVCQSGPRGYCLGCYRSREERQHWHSIDDGTKRIIIKACNRRKRADLSNKNKQDGTEPHFQQQNLF